MTSNFDNTSNHPNLNKIIKDSFNELSKNLSSLDNNVFLFFLKQEIEHRMILEQNKAEKESIHNLLKKLDYTRKNIASTLYLLREY